VDQKAAGGKQIRLKKIKNEQSYETVSSSSPEPKEADLTRGYLPEDNGFKQKAGERISTYRARSPAKRLSSPLKQSPQNESHKKNANSVQPEK